jgi:YD repeat-containing protein
MGRFNTPDPSGIGAVNLQNPTSWNMYTYVTGDPVNLNDPTGLEGNPYETCTINGITYPFSCAAATNGNWGQAFAYDGFGNLTGKTVTQGSAPTLSVSYDPATNHQVGVSYDANGNVADGGIAYDVENRMVGAPDGSSFIYDPSGKRVMKIKAYNIRELYFYGITGQKLVTYTCIPDGNGNITSCGNPATNVYFGGKLMRSGGVTVATDRLGSVRANANGERMSYYPYGEERTSTADGREKFGTYTRDST